MKNLSSLWYHKSNLSYIYFIGQDDNSGPIKIGFSSSPIDRLRHMQSWSPVKLKILAITKGFQIHERMLHEMFYEYNSHGEWFDRSDLLLQVVDIVADGLGLPDFKLPEALKEAEEFRKSKKFRASNSKPMDIPATFVDALEAK